MGMPLRIVKSKPLNGVGDWVDSATETDPGVSNIYDVILQSGILFRIDLNDALMTQAPEAGDLCVFGFDGGWRNVLDCVERAEDPYPGQQPAVQFLGPVAVALMDFWPDDIGAFPWAPPIVPEGPE